eukprot:COSAG06_NODE_802_length_12194_cov_5.561637_12_plen_78_part_00
MHHNYYDASYNYSQVQGTCVPNTTVGTTCQRLNLSAHIHDNVCAYSRRFPSRGEADYARSGARTLIANNYFLYYIAL